MKEILTVKNLVKRYKTADKNAVDNISFSVYEGEFFSLLGVNGAGKSTTINIICTLLQKSIGEITINGFKLGENDDEIRKSIGVVFQNSVLDSDLTVEENLLLRSSFYGYTQAQTKQKVEYLCDKLGMHKFMKSRYNRLSGGQRRKCDIARALLSEPKILFLDEPTTGLDPQSRIDLWETIDQFRKTENMTIFLTTHYMEETEKSDRVAIINSGKVVCIDTPQKLKSVYSSDILKLVVKDNCQKELEALIENYTLQVDTYLVQIKDNLQAIEILNKAKPYIHSFEMQKGDMDSVFINVVGGITKWVFYGN